MSSVADSRSAYSRSCSLGGDLPRNGEAPKYKIEMNYNKGKFI
ncbi:hypothetical protein LCGC14_0733090 [marine sediment metagenome]|uniref:Uncharacterized protein n=1 Tax=marine sediment metagenome TaxID=412755 RepID=A0A0F9QD48_9ZZZZ